MHPTRLARGIFGNSMNAANPYHDVKIRTPFFTKDAGAQLHRYLVPEFIPQFLRQLSLNSLGEAQNNQWKSTDRFSHHDNQLVLRLPTHKTFYLMSCEVVCNRLGTPALDSTKITSAGYVVRKIKDGKEYSWMVEEDEAVGWEETSTGLKDPDVHRHLCSNGILHPRANIPTYTGEKVHPIHPQTTTDEVGKKHTILYGFVSLGGQYLPRRGTTGASSFDAESLNEFKKTSKSHLPWPFGEKQPLVKNWLPRYSQPVQRGKPSAEFFELLRLLINRYHLGEKGVEENSALKELTMGIHFYNVSEDFGNTMMSSFSDSTKESFAAYKKYSLWSWLSAHFNRENNDIVNWMASQELEIDKAGSIESVNFERVPNKNGTGKTNYSLFLTSSDARDFRTLLEQRVLSNVISLADEMPVAKFQQARGDVYQLVPFVRAKDDHGKERIYWADATARSEMFRVAGPFDPNASRPTMIPMPSLRDLKSGMAKGVGMITPPDTFSLINALNLKKGASEDVLPKDEASPFGIQWICSFSLPVITLVAMIVLMIMISLLNIIFFWLPWIKICLPFPKLK